MPIESDRDTGALRRAIRELVAFAAMPTAWVGREPPAIAGGLADVLVGSLNLEFAFVRLCDPNGGVAIDATRGRASTAFPEWLRTQLNGGVFASSEIVTAVGGGGLCRAVAIPIGVNAEAGLVAVASSRSDFPTEIDQLLLSVAGNHAAAAFQNARLRNALSAHVAELRQASNELETKVVERTTELKLRDDERERLLDSERGALAEAVGAHERFRDLVNSVDGIVWEADVPSFRFSFVSKQAERILGYPVEQWLSEPTFWSDHLHADDRNWAVDFCLRATGEKRDHDVEYRMIAADGHVVWVRDLVTVVVQGERAARLRGVIVDITDRKQSEQERHDHVAFLENLDRINRAIQGTNDLEQMMSAVLDEVLAIFDCDRAWVVYPCDPEAASWAVTMERTRPEFPGAFPPERDVPMDPAVIEVIRATRACDGPVRFGPGSEHPLPAALATRFSLQSQMSIAIYPKGDRPYLFGLNQCSYPRVWTPQEERVFQEIGRRLADALTSLLMLRNLRHSEARLEEAQRIAHVGHWERHIGTNRGTWSDETYRIFGLAPQSGPIDFTRVQALIHPDDRDAVIRAAAEADRGGARYDVEYRVMRPNGDVHIVHSQGDVARDATGAPHRVFGIVQDITERKRAEAERQRAEYLIGQVFESSPDRVSIVGRDYRYRRVNPVAERDWKMPAERIVGMHVADLVGRDLFEQQIKPHLDRCFEGEDVRDADWFSGPLGRRYLAMSYSPLRPDPGGVPAALVITRDLTEHMLASEALRQAQADLAHVNRVTTMGELTASLAHEIKQPIAAGVTDARTCLRWLEREIPDVAEARAAASRIVKDVRRAADIISSISVLFKKGALEREPVDVNALIRDMIVLLRGEANRFSISIRTELDPDLQHVVADRIQLQQVFMNLMLNGIDAMSDTSVGNELTIKSEANTDQLVISISDTGVGLPPDHGDKIFRAFFTTKDDGTGMGLPISRSIIESHGGRLWATDHAGRGATFQFSLPAALAAHV
jgi:PAS domain S-box-containing protein